MAALHIRSVSRWDSLAAWHSPGCCDWSAEGGVLQKTRRVGSTAGERARLAGNRFRSGCPGAVSSLAAAVSPLSRPFRLTAAAAVQ